MDQPVAYWRYPRRFEEEKNESDWQEELLIEEALEDAISLDDKDEFLRLINHPHFKTNRDLSNPEEIFRLDALNCCMAVLNGETKGLVDVNDILVEGLTPLQLAAENRSVKIIKFLLERGDSVDVHPDLINCTIEEVSSGLDAGRWTPRQSVYELLVLICSTMRSELEVLRMLVWNTENKERVRQAFMDYADKRELIPVALLFLAAPELFWSSYFVIPEVASSSIATLYHVLYSLEKRTDIEEAMLLLVDALAVAGHKFVAYTRLQYPNAQAYLRSYLDVAFLVREVALNNQGSSSPDDCFLRFFKPVRPEAEQLINIPGKKRVGHLRSPRILPFELKRNDLDQAYIDRMLSGLTTEDVDCLNNAIEKKLLLMPTFYGHLEFQKQGVKFPLPSTTPKQGVKFPLPRFSVLFSTRYQSIPQPLYMASAERGFDVKSTLTRNTPTMSLRNKLMKPTKPKFLSSRLSQFFNTTRRWIK